MRRIIITDEAHRILREAVPRGTYVMPGERQPGGMWATEIDDEVSDILEAHRRPDETISDVLIRMVRHRSRPS